MNHASSQQFTTRFPTLFTLVICLPPQDSDRESKIITKVSTSSSKCLWLEVWIYSSFRNITYVWTLILSNTLLHSLFLSLRICKKNPSSTEISSQKIWWWNMTLDILNLSILDSRSSWMTKKTIKGLSQNVELQSIWHQKWSIKKNITTQKQEWDNQVFFRSNLATLWNAIYGHGASCFASSLVVSILLPAITSKQLLKT